MSQINPFSGYIAGSSQAQRQQALDKDRQIRRTQQLAKDVALQDDQLEHQVESPEELRAVQEDRDSDPQRRGNQSASGEEEGPEHVDIRA